MDKITKERIEIILEGRVVNLVGLSDNDFDLVLAMIYAARISRRLLDAPKAQHE
jgi:hypothetical protein